MICKKNIEFFEHFLKEKTIITCLSNMGVLSNKQSENIEIFEDISFVLSCVLGHKKIVNVFKSVVNWKHQIRIANVAFKEQEKWDYFTMSEDGLYFYCINTTAGKYKKLMYMWKSLEMTLTGVANKFKGETDAFNHLLKNVFTKEIVIIENISVGTMKLLKKYNLKIYGDDELTTEKDYDAPGDKYIPMPGILEREQKRGRFCDHCINPAKYAEIYYYCAEHI